MKKKYVVRLTDEERAVCEVTIANEMGRSEKLRRATILLRADADGWLGMTPRLARRSVAGLAPSRTCGGRVCSKDSRCARSQEEGDIADAKVARLAVGQATCRARSLDVAAVGRPNGGTGGRRLDLSGDRSSDTQKNGMTKRKIEYWVIPPDANGEFVANIEDVLETYEEAYDPGNPVVCMESSLAADR